MYGSGFLSWRASGELTCTHLGLSALLHCPMPMCPLVRPTPSPSSLRLNGADMLTRNRWVFEKEEVDSMIVTCCRHIFFLNLSNSRASLDLLVEAFLYSNASYLFSTVFITGKRSRLQLSLSFDPKQQMISLQNIIHSQISNQWFQNQLIWKRVPPKRDFPSWPPGLLKFSCIIRLDKVFIESFFFTVLIMWWICQI